MFAKNWDLSVSLRDGAFCKFFKLNSIVPWFSHYVTVVPE